MIVSWLDAIGICARTWPRPFEVVYDHRVDDAERYVLAGHLPDPDVFAVCIFCWYVTFRFGWFGVF